MLQIKRRQKRTNDSYPFDRYLDADTGVTSFISGLILIYRNSHRYDTKDIFQLGSRFSPLPGKSDPFNKTAEINIRGFGESVLSLDMAPEQRNGMILPINVQVFFQHYIPLLQDINAGFVYIFP